MTRPFSGRAGIVTGASSGIGKSIAQCLGEAGMELWLVGRSIEHLQETASQITAAGGPEPHCVALKLGEPGRLTSLVDEVAAQHPYLAVMVNSAGVLYGEPITQVAPERLAEMFAVNVLAPLESCKAAVAHMRKHGKPANLINISSIAGSQSKFGGGAYGASKAALSHAGRTIRYEIEQDDIRITTIVPGGFASNLARDLTPQVKAGLGKAVEDTGLDPEGPKSTKIFSDPVHIGRLVCFILEQPIDINFEEIVIRPPIHVGM
jgi:NADP-dependent 3-hydroxy acid dehydrogenase YdfG